MNPFERKLPLDELFNFLNSPRDIDEEEFCDILQHFHLDINKVLKQSTFLHSSGKFIKSLEDVLFLNDFVSSKTEYKKLLKDGSLKVNNEKVLNDFDFKNVNWLRVVSDNSNIQEFCVVKKFKTQHIIIFKILF